MRIPWPTKRGPVFLEQRAEHLEVRSCHQLEELGFRVDQQFNER